MRITALNLSKDVGTHLDGEKEVVFNSVPRIIGLILMEEVSLSELYICSICVGVHTGMFLWQGCCWLLFLSLLPTLYLLLFSDEHCYLSGPQPEMNRGDELDQAAKHVHVLQETPNYFLRGCFLGIEGKLCWPSKTPACPLSTVILQSDTMTFKSHFVKLLPSYAGNGLHCLFVCLFSFW